MPLSHIRVVDLCPARTGPTCIRQLSEFGAQIIKVELPREGNMTFLFERTSEAPGMVRLRWRDQVIDLPANEQDAERFIAAYRRAIKEDVGYRKQENE